MAMSKQRTQIVALAIIVVAILGVLLFMFRDRVLPRGVGGAPIPPTKMIDIPNAADYQALFDRPDYKMLRRDGDVPVQPVGDVGNRDLFAPPVRQGAE